MIPNKLQYGAYNIPIKILRAELEDFKSQRKKDLIEELYKRNPQLLEQLTVHYTSLKERSVFFYSVPSMPSLTQCKKNIESCKFHDNEDDFIYKSSIAVPKEQSIIITVIAASQTKEQKNWIDHEKLSPLEPRKYRKPFTLFLILHPEKILEIRTKNHNKALHGARYISMALFNKQDRIKPKILTADILKQLDPNMRSKQATLKDLNFAGAEEIILNGPDVEQASKALLNKGVIAGETIFHRSYTNQNNLKFYDNGKISSTHDVEDIYETLKGFLNNEA